MCQESMITLRFRNGEKEQFQIDTDADRTMLPLCVYKLVTGYYKLKNIFLGNDFVLNYGDKGCQFWAQQSSMHGSNMAKLPDWSVASLKVTALTCLC